ncbi:hypothetical protein [Piscibacillus salipiscarius]|uniref:hypothetical protein n=1 Tax=Piscibacillus salipiscarius TaxID=299480 RepID=UPI0024372BD1|nr:hypothetical protein [Piscibacillus salipiscarius]
MDVLKAEVSEYNNTVDNCVKVIEHQLKPIGFTGYLHEVGDDEAYIIGPVFLETYHTIKKRQRNTNKTSDGVAF